MSDLEFRRACALKAMECLMNAVAQTGEMIYDENILAQSAWRQADAMLGYQYQDQPNPNWINPDEKSSTDYPVVRDGKDGSRSS